MHLTHSLSVSYLFCYISDLIISGSALSDLLTLFQCNIEEILGLLLFSTALLQLLELSIYFLNVHAQLSQSLACYL